MSLALLAARDGTWLTADRIRTYGLTMIGLYVAVFVGVFATAHGNLDLTGKPVGTDFSQVWVAGRSVLAGHPEAPFDPRRHAMAQHLFFGASDSFYGWHYPPYFLAVATLAALLPYLPALVLWQASTFTFYLLVMRRILPGRMALIGAASFPAVYVNLGHGHNGFLTAGLMGSALLSLETRPYLAGALFALVAYKPQFGLVVPVALVAGRYWRAIAGAVAMLAAMTAASIAAFGVGSWLAFRQSLAFTRSVVLEQGNTGWEKIQSVFAAVRMWGGSISAAYVAQTIVSLCVLAAIAWVWFRPCDRRLRGAALLAGSLLTTPYCLDYDMMLLGPALALLVSFGLEHGFRRWEITGLAAIWLAPLLARLAAQYLLVPLGLTAILALFALCLPRRQAAGAGAGSQTGQTASAPLPGDDGIGRSHRLGPVRQ